MNMEAGRRVRSSNFTNCEKYLLTELCVKYKDMIDSKKTDAMSNKCKENEWGKLASEFNATSTGVPRSVAQLKHVCISYMYIITRDELVFGSCVLPH